MEECYPPPTTDDVKIEPVTYPEDTTSSYKKYQIRGGWYVMFLVRRNIVMYL